MAHRYSNMSSSPSNQEPQYPQSPSASPSSNLVTSPHRTGVGQGGMKSKSPLTFFVGDDEAAEEKSTDSYRGEDAKSGGRVFERPTAINTAFRGGAGGSSTPPLHPHPTSSPSPAYVASERSEASETVRTNDEERSDGFDALRFAPHLLANTCCISLL